MRKTISILMFLLMTGALFGQECPFKVKINVIDATCHNNGKVVYALVDDTGEVLTEIPTGLSGVRIYYKVSEVDSAHYGNYYPATCGYDTLNIEPGTYIVGVEALCSGGPGLYRRLDTNNVFTIVSTYTPPVSSLVNINATAWDQCGTRPTLECHNTGRVQLKIEGGRFPYSVKVSDQNTHSFLKTVVFDTNQNFGNNTWNQFYKDYYSIDSLPAGAWEFQVEDGCGTGMPKVNMTIVTTQFPKIDNMVICAKTSNDADSNVVQIRTSFFPNLGYYLFQRADVGEYRFTYDGFQSNGWKKYPVSHGASDYIYDTVFEASKYCEIWDKDITFEYRFDNGCESQNFSYQFQIKKPGKGQFKNDFEGGIFTSPIIRDTCFSDVGGCGYFCITHNRYHDIYFELQRSSIYEYYRSNAVENDRNPFRYHYTSPLVWKWKDLNSDEFIFIDTVDHVWDRSILYDELVESIYGSFRNTPLLINAERTLLDAKGCELYQDTIDLTYKYDTIPKDSYWEITDNYDRVRTLGYQHCYQTPNRLGVELFDYFESSYNPDGTIIRLVKSPYNNRYNFEAVYSNETNRWTVLRANAENTALITAPIIIGNADTIYSGTELYIEEKGLPSGPYHFEIVSQCDSFYLTRNMFFDDYFSMEILEYPEKTMHQQCSDLYVTYTKGKYRRESKNTDVNTGLDRVPIYYDFPAGINVHSGPNGGWGSKNNYNLNEPICLSMPGTYVIRIYPITNTSNSNCDITDDMVFFDTIYHEGSTVSYDYAVALLCDSLHTSGNVFVNGAKGTKPYTYTLYSVANMEGTVIATNTTGIFNDVPMAVDGMLSCVVTDSCGSYYSFNLIPHTLTAMQKVWFDDGKNYMTTYDDTTIRVNALEIGNILSYKWSGPGGFRDSVAHPTVRIPSGAESGWYKVLIYNTGCAEAIADSLYLKVLNPHEEILPECTPVTDADGNRYESVRIGSNCWLKRNLESKNYADNSPIGWAKGYESFLYPDVESNISIFGRLYDFASAVKDSADNGYGHVQGVCPEGWHLPTPAQYSELLGMDATTLKTPEYWLDGGGNNSTGFSWLPSGCFNGAENRFEGLLASGWFWSAEGSGKNTKAFLLRVRYSCDSVLEEIPAIGSAYSVRCVKEKGL